jgi:outer membrane protein
MDSATVLSEYKPYLDAQERLDSFWQSKQKEAEGRQRELEELISKYESQRLLLSEERKKKMEEEINRRREDYDRFMNQVFDPTAGEIARRRDELSRPIFDRISSIIQEIGEQEKFDFIFDVAPMGIVYADPKHDLTKRILDTLNKETK